jgi:hypothetical protein
MSCSALKMILGERKISSAPKSHGAEQLMRTAEQLMRTKEGPLRLEPAWSRSGHTTHWRPRDGQRYYR